MLLLNNADVAKVLDMPTCLGALDSVFQELAVGDAAGMGRIDLYVPSGQAAAPYYRWAVMAGGSKKDGYVCARMLSDMVSWPHEHGLQRGNKYAREPGTYCGMLFLFSAKDATPVAMINDGVLQHTRVGGGAGLGVKYLARKESRVLGMIGSGGMARHYLDAFRLVRPIAKVKVYSPNAENLRAYVREMSERHGIEIEPAASAREAVREVDIAACCTSASKPVFSKDWLEPGMHVTDVQASEIPHDFVRAVDIAVRAGDATAKVAPLPPEADYAHGSFLGYIAGQPAERAIVPRVVPPSEVLDMPRLADLIAGRVAGRTNDSQTTYFFNLGAIGAQFEAVASAVYEKARAQGLGTEIPTDWFLQDIRD